MKKRTQFQFVSMRNKSFLRYLLPLVILLLSVNGLFAQSQQVLGFFPFMDGGFEGQTIGACASATIAAGGTSTAWTTSSASVATLQNTVARTGTLSANFNPTSTTKRLQSPSAPLPAQQAVSATAYTIQYYYRTAGATGTAVTMQAGLSAAGTTDGSYTTAVAFPGTNGAWVKYSIPFTTKAGTTPSSPVGIIRGSIAIATAIDIDDFCVYLGSLDETAPDAPTAPSIPSPAATQMAVSWTAPIAGVDGGGYLVVRGLADPTTSPNTNGIYAVGNTIATGEKVVYLGTGTSFNDTGLSPTTAYYYRIYSVDKAFNYSTPVTINATTTEPSYAAEPTAQVTSLSFSSVSSTGFTINWTPAVSGGGTNHLVIIKAASDISADPADGSSYTADPAFSTGSVVGGGKVVYNGTGNSVTVTGLSKAILYYVKISDFNGSGGSENYLVTAPTSGNQMASPGEIVSAGTSSAGISWNTPAAWIGGVVPSQYDNATIAANDVFNVGSTMKCFNLKIKPGGKLYAGTAQTFQIYGDTLVCDGTFGDASNTASLMTVEFGGKLNISGSGGIYPYKIRPVTGLSNIGVTFDANTTITYGTVGLQYNNTGNDNVTFTVNSGKTVTLAGSLSTTSSQSGVATGNATLNVFGTLNVGPTLNTTVAVGKTYTLNVVGGSITTTKLYITPLHGVVAPIITVTSPGSITATGLVDCSNAALTAAVTGTGTFNLGSTGSISIAATTGLEPVAGPIRTAIRTFDPAASYSFIGAATSPVAQVTGSDLPSTVGSLTINNAAGVTLSAPTIVSTGLTLTSGVLNNSTNNLTLGNAGTITLTAGSLTAAPVFGTTAKLVYNGTAAQTTSFEVPTLSSVLGNLTVNNATGVSLSGSTTVNDTLTLTSGKLSIGANNLIARTISGASATNYVITDGAGTLTQPVTASGTVIFPVGASASSFDPVTVTPTSAANISAKVSGTLTGTAASGHNYNAKEWTLSVDVPSSTVVSMTPSAVTATGVNSIIGQYDGLNYVNSVATLTGNTYSGTFSTFAQFVTGATDLGTGVSLTKLNGVNFDGQIIHNNANLDLQVYDATGRLKVSSSKNINLTSYSKGVYLLKSNQGSCKIVKL